MPYFFTNVLGISNTAPEGIIPDSVKWSFYIGALVFLSAILWTVFKSTEYPPEAMEEINSVEKEEAIEESDIKRSVITSKLFKVGMSLLMIGVIASFFPYYFELQKELFILTLGLAIIGLLFLVAGRIRRERGVNGFVTIMTDLIQMPETMKQLAWVQFFSWFALFAMWIYTTPAVTGHIYGTQDSSSKLYNDAADWVTVLFGVYNGVAALVAFLLPVLAKKTNLKVTHLTALVLGGLGLISIYFIKTPEWLIVSMIGVGIAWASILSMPYALLAGALPAHKMGYYMGVFNFFIVIPQMVAATLLGFMVKGLFDGQPIYALFIGGFAMIFSGILTLRVRETPK
jgi:maltose/moltooligosaccharide transporter